MKDFSPLDLVYHGLANCVTEECKWVGASPQLALGAPRVKNSSTSEELMALDRLVLLAGGVSLAPPFKGSIR